MFRLRHSALNSGGRRQLIEPFDKRRLLRWYENVRKELKFKPNNVKTKGKVSLLIGTDLPHFMQNDDMAPF
jgi:hypothetical protein